MNSTWKGNERKQWLIIRSIRNGGSHLASILMSQQFEFPLAHKAKRIIMVFNYEGLGNDGIHTASAARLAVPK